MDANKLIKLKEIDYSIQKCCGLCRYARMSSDGWGECHNTSYKREKHNAIYWVSINRYGYCDQFSLDEKAEEKLGKFDQFLEGEKQTPKRVFELED
jgi:hypothetical protein